MRRELAGALQQLAADHEHLVHGRANPPAEVFVHTGLDRRFHAWLARAWEASAATPSDPAKLEDLRREAQTGPLALGADLLARAHRSDLESRVAEGAETQLWLAVAALCAVLVLALGVFVPAVRHLRRLLGMRGLMHRLAGVTAGITDIEEASRALAREAALGADLASVVIVLVGAGRTCRLLGAYPPSGGAALLEPLERQLRNGSSTAALALARGSYEESTVRSVRGEARRRMHAVAVPLGPDETLLVAATTKNGDAPLYFPDALSQIAAQLSSLLSNRRARTAEGYLAAIVSSTPDAIIGKDIAGNIVSWNRGAEQMYGYTAEEMVGQPIAILVPPSRQTDELPNLMKVLSPDATVDTYETQRVRKDGVLIDVAVSVAPIRDEGGRVVGSSTIARDITPRKVAERSLRKSAHELARSNRELESFANAVSHDLKAPLRALRHLSEWVTEALQEGRLEEAQGDLGELGDRLNLLDSMLDGLLAYSRAGGRATGVEPVNLGDLMASVVDLVHPPAAFEVRWPSAPMTLHTHKAPLQQVLLNLVSNALRHHDRASGTVEVTWRPADAGYEFAVTDDGPGIAEDSRQRIFDIFQTLKAKEQGGGLGIGLAIVKRAVEAQGGMVEVESAPGRGARFRFTWPTRSDPPPRSVVTS